MFSSYFKTIFRNMLKHKGYSFINIAGLAMGIACTIMILLWVQHELSYDRYHVNADRIYRVTFKFDRPGYNPHFARIPNGWVNSLPEEYAEIKDLVRFHHELRTAVKYQDKKYSEPRFFYADPNVLDIFSFRIIRGDSSTVLKEPNSVVVSTSTAARYFGEENPIGKTLATVSRFTGEETEYKITGVMENMPDNSHFHMDFLASHYNAREDLVDEWNYTYILLDEGVNPAELEKQFDIFLKKHISPEAVKILSMPLQALTDIHLYSGIDREIEPNGNVVSVYIFAIIAVLILAIACINFMNLTTARSAGRAVETGIRKTLGATRGQLIGYFIGESILFSVGALIIAIILVESLLPAFNQLSGKSLTLNYMADRQYLLILTLLPVVVGIIAGSYPAFYLSSVRPVTALKTAGGNLFLPDTSNASNKLTLRNILVVVQYAIAITLIICCAITYFQHDFLMAKRLGSKGDQVIAIPNVPMPATQTYSTFKEELIKHPSILNVTASMEEPSKRTLDAMQVELSGADLDSTNNTLFTMVVEKGFFDFYNIKFAAGGEFHHALSDSVPEYVLNESAVQFLGLDSPEDAIGREFKPQFQNPVIQLKGGPITGVVKDFNFSTLQEKIKPLFYMQKSIWLLCFQVKIDPEKTGRALSLIEETWNRINPEYPFEYYFVDDLYARLYASEEKQGTILGIFSILAITIACLGLFGLAAYTVERRTKEIGIRKVLGASISNIIMLLSGEFTRWVIVANLIAWPIAYYAMRNWLDNFAYRIGIDWIIFALAAVTTLLIAVLTIGYLAVRAALANPVEALRYE